MRRREFLQSLILVPAAGKVGKLIENLLRYLPKDIVLPRNPVLEGTFQDMELPGELVPQKNFWKRVYTEITNSQAVFYDPKTFEIDEVVNLKDSKAIARKKAECRKKYSSSRYETGQADAFRKGLEKAAPYWNHCRRAFANNGVSDDMIYMAFLESCFNPSAISASNAVGAFQFLRGTALHFLEINEFVDERYDPIKEAEAAALLLRALYARYGDELLALNAYHSGEGNLDKAKIFTNHYSEASTNSHIFSDIVQVFPALTKQISPSKGRYGFKSSQYVPAFFGVKEGLQELLHSKPEQENLDYKILIENQEMEFDSLVLKYSQSIRIRIMPTTTSTLGLTAEEIALLNPGFLYLRNRNKSNRMPAGYELRLPLGKGNEFIEAFKQYLDKNIGVKEQRKGEAVELVTGETKGDQLYREVIALRKKQEPVSLDMLKEIKAAYEADLKTNPEYLWLANSLKVVKYDISKLARELNQNYSQHLELYEKRIKRVVDRMISPSVGGK